MSNLYTAKATATGGRAGHTKSDDGRIDLNLSVPRGMGGDDGPGTNPEQLFAAGYAACFQGALGVVARRDKIELSGDQTITALVGLSRDSGTFALDVELQGHFPGLDEQQAMNLMKAAHEVCPYSAATRGNVDVRLSVK
ncbi:organic hydroperoxide resistance protein [Deinococcus humi]|uniref:Ohr subfamily peroxiredoxin n=1 Tax=Deinococcus humi TaxID=662880 RepID=A0A7W8JRK4_9DEIO|nr:organic hydroperoxide resistance protein [Deinococcus humi]MBB5361834.1 Ohr subfamily peroxiredoxin [Deinococcus humi]GGO23410.1 organic hydroperoxide resistance protein [Deinococcus humi]